MEPASLKALLEQRAGTMETLPEIRRRDAQGLLNLLGTHAVQLPEEECVGQSLGKLGEATAKNGPELTRLQHPARLASPVGKARSPVSPPVEPRISPVGRAAPVRVHDRLPAHPAKVIANLVPEDADQPGPFTGMTRERTASSKGFQKGLLNDVGGQVRGANPQQRVPVENVAVPIHPLLGFGRRVDSR